MGNILTSMGGLVGSLIFAKSASDSLWTVLGQFYQYYLLLLFSGGFGNSFRTVLGQSRLIFGQFLGSI